jgi:hypothetical protein
MASARLPRLRTLLLVVAFAGPVPRAGAQAPGAHDSRADYRITARVDDDEGGFKRLAGLETVTWTNGSEEAVGELWFHLYHNAFANNRSTHLAPEGGKLRGERVMDGWGWQRVTAVRAGDQDLMPSFRYRVEEEGSPEDLTVFSVELPAPVPPGGSIDVEVTWEARIQKVRRRTGAKGDFLLMAHWYPQLGVYESGRGWNCHTFYTNTEFFADYGTYDVTLDLPAAYESSGNDVKVGASGVEVGPSSKTQGRVVKHFVAPSERDQRTPDRTGRLPLLHGFAWTADPDYRTYGGTFHYDDWAAAHPEAVDLALGALGPDKDLRLRDVDVTVLLQPEHWSQAQRHFDATCAALFFYGLWYGEYPYEHLTVVDPAWGAGAAGGMEYPTLFTAGTRLFTFPGMQSPEGVTVHECGHQFWYGVVGNNETEAAWLDEGLNSYTDSEVLWTCYGYRHKTTDYARIPLDGLHATLGPGEGKDAGLLAQVLSGRRWPLPWLGVDLEPLRPRGFVALWRDQPLLTFTRQRDDPRWEDRARYLQDPDSDPIVTAGWRYADRQSYVVNSYRRTAVVLRTLRGLIGDEAFLRGMRTFSERWRYAHPYPDDFFDAFIDGAGVDVRWYFDETFRGTGTVDWSVEVEERRVPAPRGFFQAQPGGPFTERAPDAAAAAIEKADDEERTPAQEHGRDARPWAVDLVLRRKGELALPLSVQLTFADGTSVTREWSREAQLASRWWRPLGRWAEFPEKLKSVVLDPEGRYYLDTDMSNNRWYDETDEEAPLRWAERVLTELTHVLHWYAGIGG